MTHLMQGHAVFDVLCTRATEEVFCVVNAVTENRHVSSVHRNTKHAIIVVSPSRKQEVPTQRAAVHRWCRAMLQCLVTHIICAPCAGLIEFGFRDDRTNAIGLVANAFQPIDEKLHR